MVIPRSLRFGILLALLSLPVGHWALALEIPPPPAVGARWGYVSDFAGALTDAQRDALEARLKALDASDSTQVAVVVIKSLEGEALEDFSVRLAQGWGIGRKGKDNGALLLVALEDRAVRIEVGYGLEERLTDALSGMIIRNQIVPAFKQGDYAGGIQAGVEAIAAVVRGAYQNPGNSAPALSGSRAPPEPWMFLIIFFGLFVFLILKFLLNRVDRTFCGGRLRSSGLISRGSGFGGGGFGGFGGGSFGGGGASGRW